MVVANAAVDGRSSSTQRAEWCRYLRRFVHFFTDSVFLERAFTSIINGENDTLLNDLQLVFKEWKRNDDDDDDDVRMWLYGEEYKFDVERATELFRFLDILEVKEKK